MNLDPETTLRDVLPRRRDRVAFHARRIGMLSSAAFLAPVDMMMPDSRSEPRQTRLNRWVLARADSKTVAGFNWINRTKTSLTMNE